MHYVISLIVVFFFFICVKFVLILKFMNFCRCSIMRYLLIKNKFLNCWNKQNFTHLGNKGARLILLLFYLIHTQLYRVYNLRFELCDVWMVKLVLFDIWVIAITSNWLLCDSYGQITIRRTSLDPNRHTFCFFFFLFL